MTLCELALNFRARLMLAVIPTVNGGLQRLAGLTIAQQVSLQSPWR